MTCVGERVSFITPSHIGFYPGVLPFPVSKHATGNRVAETVAVAVTHCLYARLTVLSQTLAHSRSVSRSLEVSSRISVSSSSSSSSRPSLLAYLSVNRLPVVGRSSSAACILNQSETHARQMMPRCPGQVALEGVQSTLKVTHTT